MVSLILQNDKVVAVGPVLDVLQDIRQTLEEMTSSVVE